MLQSCRDHFSFSTEFKWLKPKPKNMVFVEGNSKPLPFVISNQGHVRTKVTA